MAKPKQQLDYALLDQIDAESAAENGERSEDVMIAKLAEAIMRDPHRREEIAFQAATSMVDSYVKARAPKVSDQIMLFDHDAVIKFADRMHIPMGLAQIEHLNGWERIAEKNFKAQTDAYWAKKRYIMDARDAMLDLAPDATLSDYHGSVATADE